MENYLQVLEESLHKKVSVLERMSRLNEEQEKLLSEKEVDMDAFDLTLDQKGTLIDELNKLDEGFESLYQHIKEQLAKEKEKYRPHITRLQEMIAKITDQSVSLQAQEARNKRLAEQYFSRLKKEVKQGRVNSKAALDYYRNMNKSSVIQPQFMDKKN